jgi:hypothetical protein
MARSVKRQLEQAGFSQGWEQIKKQEESSLRTRIWAQDEIAITHPQHATSTEPPVLDEERTVEAAIHQPPVQAPPAHTKEAPLEDPWEKGKTAYKVDVLELLKWTIASDLEHEHVKGERAITYLMLDNYYEKVMVTGIPGLNLELQNGEEQAIYYWFYRKSYGYGYSACPMGQIELANKLQWSRDRVKRHLASLIKKGHITPLEQYKMFQNYRPQVFEVAFPRILLQRKIDQIKDEAHRAFVREQIAKVLGESSPDHEAIA